MKSVWRCCSFGFDKFLTKFICPCYGYCLLDFRVCFLARYRHWAVLNAPFQLVWYILKNGGLQDICCWEGKWHLWKSKTLQFYSLFKRFHLFHHLFHSERIAQFKSRFLFRCRPIYLSIDNTKQLRTCFVDFVWRFQRTDRLPRWLCCPSRLWRKLQNQNGDRK